MSHQSNGNTSHGYALTNRPSNEHPSIEKPPVEKPPKEEPPQPHDDPDSIICVPVNLDAFILNEKVCDTGLVRIAPITQPDYRGLRPNNQEVQHDILPHVDVSKSQPARLNSRIAAVETPAGWKVDPNSPATDVLAQAPLRQNRIGTYLQWSLPRAYRAATVSAEGTDPGLNQNPSTSPTFRLIPNRWLIVRTIVSSHPPPGPKDPITRAWMIDSDRLRKVEEFGDNVDLEIEASPFVAYNSGDETNTHLLDQQAGLYIGGKTPFESWSELGSTVSRVPLTIMNSSNFSFADNTIHNPNVLSMLDDMTYSGPDGTTGHYDSAICDYTVFGWHQSKFDDPLNPKGALKGPLAARLKALFCILDDDASFSVGDSLDAARLICFGKLSTVKFELNSKPIIPAEQFGNLFTSDAQMEPVSIGTTPLDSVLTFLQAHRQNEDAIFGPGASAIAQEILNIRELLYATEDTYDSRVKAADLIYAENFRPGSGGTEWHYAEKAAAGEPPSEPSSIPDSSGVSEEFYLEKVNDLQSRLDAANRKLKWIQWSLFALWWKYISDQENANSSRQAQYQNQAAALHAQAVNIKTLIDGDGSAKNVGLTNQIDSIVRSSQQQGPIVAVPKVEATSIALPPFYQREDPTICIAGMDSGWPAQYSGYIPVDYLTRFARSVVTTPILLPPGNTPALDPSIAFALGILFTYCSSPSLNHKEELGFKIWNGQPWRPLYIEWEGTYFHIPFDKWSVQILNSPVGNNHDQVRYGIQETLYEDPQSTSDRQAVSGRIILTPQPMVNLKALVAQVLSSANTPQPHDMNVGDLLNGIDGLKLTSSTLQGITSSLLTLAEGTHVQPNLSIPGLTDLFTLAAATAAGGGSGLTGQDYATMGAECASTPLGALAQANNASTTPFKPVTHGQFRFTKLNIVDAFGQVISGITPVPDERQPALEPESIHPCLGDQVCPGLIPGTTNLNTVTALTNADPRLPGGYPLCPYVQLTPAINQNTRLNAAFVEAARNPAGAFDGWKATNYWEQPVWAWVCVNIADYGLQFFTADGTFYIEMSLGGPTGSISSLKWLPFDPPQTNSVNVSPQLVQLIQQFTGTNGDVYLRSFWDMVTQALVNMPHAPADYAAYSSSIIGKPLALVNVGFSLELEAPPLQSQVSISSGSTPATSTPPDLLAYEFPIKIGDADRPYDGVVGYFNTDNTTSGSTAWENLYTYFTATGAPTVHDPRTLIQPSSFPKLSPYFVDPVGPLKNNSFKASHGSHFLVKTMLIDPYTPLHVYSPILPITSLQLPSWMVQKALQKMSAFFKLGPCLLTKDVAPVYNPAKAISADTWVQTQQSLTTDDSTADVRLPLLTGSKKGLWSWLQPYVVDGDPAPRYNALSVDNDDGRFRLDPGPYTMVEGFLQLTQPLES